VQCLALQLRRIIESYFAHTLVAVAVSLGSSSASLVLTSSWVIQRGAVGSS